MNSLSVSHRGLSWLERKPGAVLILVLGAASLIAYVALQRSLPMESDLVEISGKLLWTKTTKKSFYFGVTSDPSQFVIDSKGDWGGSLSNAVRDSMGQKLTVRYFKDKARQPIYLEGIYYPVGGIKVEGKDVRPFQEFLDSYQRDNLVALFVGIAFSSYGSWRLYWLARRRNDG